MFIECFRLIRKLTNFDLAKIENGTGMLASESAIFSWPGISFTLSRKVLDSVKDKIDKNDFKSVLYHRCSEFIHNWLIGDWAVEEAFDDHLIDLNTGRGEFFFTSVYIFWFCHLHIERGYFEGAQRMVEKLTEIADTYENDFPKSGKYVTNAALLAKLRMFPDTLAEVDKGIQFSTKIGFEFNVLSMYASKARIQMLMRDIKGAEESLKCARKIKSKIDVVPIFLGNYLLSQFVFDLQRMEESSKNSNRSELVIDFKKVLKSGKNAVKNSYKAAPHRVEAYKLMGTCHWLIGKQIRALKWWNESIKEGERIGARLELSRTYLEIGKRLTEPSSKYRELKGVKAEEFLKKAKSMFTEMDLLWDLDELDRIVAFK